ncbi:holin family protein [Evansella clarkii]|uniref:phage holin family protein n=1 Tax=Evansella clarkii TaxID=79879 RepID=UPI000B43F895|nr:phage holin family protein [Evansella clarkii]
MEIGGIDLTSLGVTEWSWHFMDLDFRVLYLLLILMFIDVLTGLMKAWHQGNLWSRKGMFGFMRKILILLVIAAAAIMDEIFMMGGVIAGATLLFFCISEIISILENAEAMGVPVPEVLKNKLAVIKEKDNHNRSVGEDLRQEFSLGKDESFRVKVEREEKGKDDVG